MTTENEVERLRAALLEAIDGMERMIIFVDPWVRATEGHDEHIARAKIAAVPSPAASETRT
jgi:hypothetical protein